MALICGKNLSHHYINDEVLNTEKRECSPLSLLNLFHGSFDTKSFRYKSKSSLLNLFHGSFDTKSFRYKSKSSLLNLFHGSFDTKSFRYKVVSIQVEVDSLHMLSRFDTN